MSVVGFDLGHKTSLMAAPRAGGIEVLANEYSQRATASVVSFSGKRRVLGESARQNMVMNFKNTIAHFKHLIGRKYKDADVQAELARFAVRHQEMPDGTVGFVVNYRDEDVVVSLLQVVSMLLVQLKANAAAALETNITDVCIGVPCHFTDTQRHALLDACRIAGLNCLKLFNETAAVALTYGIYKQDLPAEGEKPRRVIFVDMGHSQTQISCCDYNKGKLTVLLTKSALVGGRDFNLVLFDHFAAEFKERYKLDVKSNARATIRLEAECEKLKHLMSANATRIPLNVECIMEDTDVSSGLAREEFEELAKPVLARIQAVVQEFVDALGALEEPVSLDDIYAVEVVGGSTRVPAVKQILSDLLKKELSTTINSDEGVCRGCALQGAIKSPTFRVRDFTVVDRINFGVELNWQSQDESEPAGTIFKANSKANVSKIISFNRAEPFEITATYAEPAVVPGNETTVGSFKIEGVTPSYDNEPQKVKVKIKLDEHGTFHVDSATLYEKLPQEEEPKEEVKADKPADEPVPMDTDEVTPAPEGAAEPAANAAPDVDMPDATPDATPEAASPEKEEPKKKAKTTRTRTLPVIESKPGSRTEVEMQTLIEKELEFASNDRQEIEKGHAKNALEEYIYDVRDKLSTIYEAFIKEEEREDYSRKLTEAEDWLYDEGEDQPKSVYQERLSALRKVGDGVSTRYSESQTRPAALEKLQRSVVRFEKFVQEYAAGDEKYSHIDKTDADKVAGWVSAKRKWLDEKTAAQAALSNFDVPVLLTSAIEAANSELEALCTPIVTKSKPPPPKEEPAPAPAPAPEAEAAPAAEGDAPPEPMEAEPAPAENTPEAPAAMDLD